MHSKKKSITVNKKKKLQNLTCIFVKVYLAILIFDLAKFLRKRLFFKLENFNLFYYLSRVMPWLLWIIKTRGSFFMKKTPDTRLRSLKPFKFSMQHQLDLRYVSSQNKIFFVFPKCRVFSIYFFYDLPKTACWIGLAIR